MSLSGPASRIRHLLHSAATTILITLVTLAVTEILLRVADFRGLRQDASERSLSYGYDAELGWVPVPGSVSTVTTARTIHAKHNSLGFRDIEFKPDGRPVMMFLGDSFVWGVDAEASERFTDILRNKLPGFSNRQRRRVRLWDGSGISLAATNLVERPTFGGRVVLLHGQ